MIKEITLNYFQSLANDPNHRYKSWEHCHQFFRNNHQNLRDPAVLDHASLHLAFYLASWGMLRGGSFLLQKDYKVHKNFLQHVVMKEKYQVFFQGVVDIQLLLELIQDTTQSYFDEVKEVGGEEKEIQITDTLVTKILLGIFGNVPAYDRYFKYAAREHGISGSLNENSLQQLQRFYEEHIGDFEKVAQEIEQLVEVSYPPMKLVDMYLFNYGLIMDTEKYDVEKVKQMREFANEQAKTLSKVKSNGTPRKDGLLPRGSVVQSVREFILAKLEEERKTGVTHIDLKSSDIHRQMNFKDRLPSVCNAMNTVDGYRIEVIHETPSKLSSTNVVRYFFD